MDKSSQNNRFWNWSVDVYANQDTKTACLRLQDEFALDVNTLLWLCWLASNQKSPDVKALDKCADISQQWNYTLTRNVRNARKSLGDAVLESGKTLKADLLKLELLFEYRQQSELEKIPVLAETGESSSAELCRIHLDFYLASQEISSPQCAKLLDKLRKSIFKAN